MASYRGHLVFAGLLGAGYGSLALLLFIRYGLSNIFGHLAVHRGRFHSIPPLLIAGLTTYLIYPSEELRLRVFLACGVMLGLLSRLILDELYSVDFMGVRLRLNPYAGSAVKLVSKSGSATLTVYVLLAVLAWRLADGALTNSWMAGI